MTKGDAYKSLSANSMGEYKEKGSKFISYAFPLKNIDDIEISLTQVKKEHPKARHHCYAYRIGIDKNLFRVNDDGEPSGTAGRPIIGQIDSYGLSDVLIVVVRYFGGTLLGASGLIRSYKLSAADAIENGNIIDCYVEDQYRIDFSYEIMPMLMEEIKKSKINITEQKFEESPFIKIAIRQSETDQKLIKLKARLLKISIDQVDENTVVEGMKISPIS